MGQRPHRLLLASSLAALLFLSACGRKAPEDVTAGGDAAVSTTATATTSTTAVVTTTEAPNAASIYVVMPGDTLGKIATAYGLVPDDLATLNGIDNPNRIRVGDTLTIPPGATSTSTTPTTAAPPPPPEETVVETTTGLAEPTPADPGAAEQ